MEAELDDALGPSFAKLCSQVRGEFASNVPSPRKIAAIANHLGKFGRGGMHEVLNFLSLDPTFLSHIASRSYLHGNGFYKLTLCSENDFTIRFHVWMPGAMSQENLHSHRWPFASVITDGTLRGEIWSEAVGRAPLYDEYFYVGKDSGLVRLGSAKVELAEYFEHRAGDTYTLASHVLHRVISTGDQLTATMMCRSTHCMQWSRNINVNDNIPKVTPQYMSADELRGLIRDYLSLSGNTDTLIPRFHNYDDQPSVKVEKVCE